MTGYVPNDLLSRLATRDLNSVVFVMDYLQLTFDGPVLTCFTWPAVDTGSDEIRMGEPGYRNALCSLLTETVTATHEATGTGLVLEFSHGAIRMHPALDEPTGPEIAILNGFDDNAWMCWRPGEGVFEDLT